MEMLGNEAWRMTLKISSTKLKAVSSKALVEALWTKSHVISVQNTF